jgi:hypothetical protein
MTNKPAHEIRIGAIRATIWTNALATGVTHNVTLSRSYRKDGKWRSTDSFGRDDLLKVAKVLDLAHSWILDQRATI